MKETAEKNFFFSRKKTRLIFQKYENWPFFDIFERLEIHIPRVLESQALGPCIKSAVLGGD